MNGDGRKDHGHHSEVQYSYCVTYKSICYGYVLQTKVSFSFLSSTSTDQMRQTPLSLTRSRKSFFSFDTAPISRLQAFYPNQQAGSAEQATETTTSGDEPMTGREQTNSNHGTKSQEILVLFPSVHVQLECRLGDHLRYMDSSAADGNLAGREEAWRRIVFVRVVRDC